RATTRRRARVGPGGAAPPRTPRLSGRFQENTPPDATIALPTTRGGAMQILSSQHLAELLMGIARAQAASVQAVESEGAEFRSTHALPALQNAAHLRDHPEPTLIDLP